jgi:hypothetical protein
MDKEITGDLPGGLAQPALRALHRAGIVSIEDLSKLSEAEVKNLHGIGPNALVRLKSALLAKHMTFAEPVRSNGRLERAR